MKRKIIELGHDCMVLSLPRKWVLKNNLKKGDDLSVELQDDGLFVSLSEKQKRLSEITLDLEDVRETLTRTVLVNNYRIGYDRMIIRYTGKKQQLNDIVDKHLLGFELFSKDKNTYIIESVSEPSYDQFDNIIRKIFFIIKEIINTFDKEDISEQVIKVQKYDNFLKRCISKTVFDPREKMFLWQFLSDMTHISREFLHLSIHLNKKSDDYEQGMIKRLYEMICAVENAYTQKNIDLVKHLHKEDEKLLSERKAIFKRFKDPLKAYYYLHIARLIFLLNSPLIGIISTDSHNNAGIKA